MTAPHSHRQQFQMQAMRLLANIGYTVLSREEALQARGGNHGRVLLEEILRNSLERINRFTHKEEEHEFTPHSVQQAIGKLKQKHLGGMVTANEAVHDLLTLGTALEQEAGGDRRSHTFRYIDWDNPANNAFHAAAEFSTESAGRNVAARPSIVLFVNGIPFAVIECKRSDKPDEDPLSQMLRYQRDDSIPHLFHYAQLVMALNGADTPKYGTVGTERKFWGIWREVGGSDDAAAIAAAVNKQVPEEQDSRIRESLETAGTQDPEPRATTPQDEIIYRLCRPERLLELTRRFVLFEGGTKKIARYQQYFVVKEALKRIARRDDAGRRSGGVIWQTQGSGKSLTMVMLIKSLTLAVEAPRVILVTDRVDLDRQLSKTFQACGRSHKRANNGADLLKCIKNGEGAVTTVINKFEGAWNREEFVDGSTDIIVLVDECHRSVYGDLAAPMHRMLPNACFIGFTGTPLLQSEKRNTFAKFGEMIEPHYSVRQAVEDQAVVPLLHEGRLAELWTDSEALDEGFGEITKDMTRKQKADLKSKYARASMLEGAEDVIRKRAEDISQHYRDNWQERRLKAQLVAPSKDAAIRYHQILEEIGEVSSAVIISPPDAREWHEEPDKDPAGLLWQFWTHVVTPQGGDSAYSRKMIEQFTSERRPEILIVVDRLLTGFDAPANSVMYFCKKLRHHNLLQAIARVNRLHEGKQHGYIVDYVGILGELNAALHTYGSLEGYSPKDIEGAIASVREVVEQLPRKHANLLDAFRDIRDRNDAKAIVLAMEDGERREEFYNRLRQYGECLSIAMSSTRFLSEIGAKQLDAYKEDMKHFMRIRQDIQYAYSEKVDFNEHEAQIGNLLDIHLQAAEVVQLHEPIDIFDQRQIDSIVEAGRGNLYRRGDDEVPRADADTLANALKRVFRESMEEDPALHKRFSEMLQEVIDARQQGRLADQRYTGKVKDIRNRYLEHREARSPEVPVEIRGDSTAYAFYNVARDVLPDAGEKPLCALAIAAREALHQERKVDFWHDDTAQRKVRGRLDNFYYDVMRDKHKIELSDEQMDEITERIMRIAHRKDTPQ